MDPIRVLYIDHVSHLSGAEQSLFDLVVGLAGGPVEPVVVLPEDGPLATQLRAAGVLVRKVKMSKRLLETSRTTLSTRPFVAIVRLISFIAASLRLRHIIKEMHPQVVHTNTLKTHLLAIIPTKLAGVPLVWHVRDILPKGWLRRAFTFCARFPDRIVVPSRAVAQSMGRNKTVYRKLRLIPNGIRVDTFGDRDEGLALRDEIGAGAKDPVIGIVGRIAPWKGQDVFIHAAAMVADRHPRARFAVVGTPMFGDDQFQHDLASLVYDYELDGKVCFAGWRSAQEAMSAIDVVVHASIEPEPFGRTIIEAMASGKPIVAAAGGAVGEILPPNAGFVVPPGRPEILADALENLLSDKRLREEMGENGKAAASRFFDVRRTVAAVGTLYGEISRESHKKTAKRRRAGGLRGLLPSLRRRPARPNQRPGIERVQAMRGRPPMPNRRPGMNADRLPPVLRPESPDSIPAGRPKRRTPAESASSEGPFRPVRRTARIEIDIDTEEEIERAPRSRRAGAAVARETVGRRPIPAMREPRERSRPQEPERRVHRHVEYEGGHVIRRPAALEDPSYVEPEIHDEQPIVPVRRDVAPEVRALLDAPTPRPTLDLSDESEPEPEQERKKKERRKALFRGNSGGRNRRPEPEVPISRDATATVLEPAVFEPEPEPVRRPVVVRPAPMEIEPEPNWEREPVQVRAPEPKPIVTPIPFTVEHKPVYELVKRIIDVVVAAIVLVVGSPVWLATALAIKLDSRGPVLFKGTVWGKNCKPFTYYKFRSMKMSPEGGADDGHREFIAKYVQSGAGVSAHDGKTVFKYVGDSRITRIGRWIRKLSVDEIPQLVNVLRGDMSLVGPRPPLGYEFELYDDWAKQRLAVRPGMTGLQQTYARHSAAFTEKVEMDLAYIRDRGMLLDLTIIAKTIPAAFKGE